MRENLLGRALLEKLAPGPAFLPFPPVTSSRRPRVLLVTESKEPSGVGEHMITLATALRRRLQPVLMFADSPGGAKLAERASARGLACCTLAAEALAGGSPEFAAALRGIEPGI